MFSVTFVAALANLQLFYVVLFMFSLIGLHSYAGTMILRINWITTTSANLRYGDSTTLPLLKARIRMAAICVLWYGMKLTEKSWAIREH